MNGINKVILIGRLGKEPEVKHMPSGKTVVNISLATNDVWKDRDTGEKKTSTEWHNVVLFGRQAEIVAEYVHKGDIIYIEGKLKTEYWENSSGEKKNTTKIIVNVLQLMPSGKSTYNSDKVRKEAKEKEPKPEFTQSTIKFDLDEDIPFATNEVIYDEKMLQMRRNKAINRFL